MKECSLIGTLPNLSKRSAVHEMMSSNEISSVRYNTGVNNLMTTDEVLTCLKELESIYKKKIWLDIKGRQLRITKWADPSYQAIELNHNIEVEYPAHIIFRNGTKSEIVRTRGNSITVYPPPKEAVGSGQSVNILAKSLDINGYLTEKDKEFITKGKEYGFNDIMASFIEDIDDLVQILKLNSESNIVSKIESLKGVRFMLEYPNISLMAARDDLYIETGKSIETLKILREIIKRDKEAICASRIFTSLEHSEDVELSDYEDLELMYQMGYKNYMLCDNVSNYCLKRALKSWRNFVNE